MGSWGCELEPVNHRDFEEEYVVVVKMEIHTTLSSEFTDAVVIFCMITIMRKYLS
jgi:hypothetical protein